MTLIIQKPTGASLNLRKTWQPMDPDAAAYITAVETADGQALEEKTKIAIDNFVLGCKADGIWSAIKASCILAGARTLNGALVPLVGAAPTRFGTEGGWIYDRKTGLAGNGSNNYISSGRAANSDVNTNRHLAVHVTTFGLRGYIGSSSNNAIREQSTGQLRARISDDSSNFAVISTSPGLVGASRSGTTSKSIRLGKTNYSALGTFQVAEITDTTAVFAESLTATPGTHRLAFYSIGESLDLALLDARVTDLINAFAAAIP
jgi:hypothetical protein